MPSPSRSGAAEVHAFGRDDRGVAAAAQRRCKPASGVMAVICASVSQPVALTTKQPASSA
jgi:hypothetical protein